MAQNSVPVFLNGEQRKVKPNMRAWRHTPNPSRRALMQPGAVVVHTGRQAELVLMQAQQFNTGFKS